MILNVKAFGLAVGIVCGLSIFLLTYWFLFFGYQGSALAKLSGIYFGYSVSLLGGFVGLLWGFIDGFIGGACIAWFYNKFASQSSG
jgi:hypothetical protein